MRTCTSTRSSGMKRSQSSGSEPTAFGPELDGVVAAGDEAHAVFVGLEAERAQAVRRLLLGGDVATDDGGALAGGEAARAAALVVVAAGCARRLHEHRRRHAVGADVDLDVVVGGAQRDARLGERRRRRGAGTSGVMSTTSATCERSGSSAPTSSATRGRPCAMSDGRLSIDSEMYAVPHQAADAARRDAAIDGARPALLRVDVPAGAALEPAALVERELARVAGALERGLHEDRGSVGTQLEIEARAEGLVAEAQLHHLRLEDDASSLEEREEIGGVFTAHLDADAARARRSRGARGRAAHRDRRWASAPGTGGARSPRAAYAHRDRGATR